MAALVILAGLALGPLLLARVGRLPATPGPVVVSPTAPKLDLAVVVDADPDLPTVKPLLATLTGQRPQPREVTVATGAEAGDASTSVVVIEPHVQLPSPDALARIAHALERDPHVAVYPWRKKGSRRESLGTFFVIWDALTMGSTAPPTALVARRAGATGPPRVLLGGHIVAERVEPDAWASRRRSATPLGVLAAAVFVAAAAAAAVGFVADPNWASFGLYAAAVFAISLCLRQVGSFTRLATLVYPVTLGAWALAWLLPIGRGTRSRN